MNITFESKLKRNEGKLGKEPNKRAKFKWGIQISTKCKMELE